LGASETSFDETFEESAMAEKIASQLEAIMGKLSSVESRHEKLEGIFKRFANLETVVNKNQTELESLKAKKEAIEKSVGETEKGMAFANSQIEDLNKKDQENARKIKNLNY